VTLKGIVIIIIIIIEIFSRRTAEPSIFAVWLCRTSLHNS
jgi:hypothetical protein